MSDRPAGRLQTAIGHSASTDAVRPIAPRTLRESGLSLDLITQLVLKTLYFSGELTGLEIAKRLGVAFAIVEHSLDFLKTQRHCEIVGGAMVGGASYRYQITSEGRTVAGLHLQQNQYVGAAPVPLKQYCDYVRVAHGVSGAPAGARVTREDVRAALSHLVLSDAVIDEIGPAINGGRSIFIYGAPGNGKTVLARGLRNLLPGDIAVPHALEVEGHIVRVFDPVVHEAQPADTNGPDGESLARPDELDERWVMCRRPMLVAGGELTLESLDLSYSPRVGYYRAPLQLLANGGILIIDDFGRQRCAPHDLLNRWMVPLESGVDFLTLQTGLKFEVPFLALVAFATNLKPLELVDEAFLRRVQYKVFAPDPTVENFIRIFEIACRQHGVPFERELVNSLLDRFYKPTGAPLRACQPRDLIGHALLLAEYRGEPRRLTVELLESACANYFVEDQQRSFAKWS